MRITGGVLAGRRLRVPGGGVRPTQDRVRQSLFSILAARVPGCAFLDLFAGSGAVGLEAWSRGAGRVCWVESDRRTLAVLRENVALLVPESPVSDKTADRRQTGQAWGVYGGNALSFLRGRGRGGEFDIIHADPPYDSAPRGSGGPVRGGNPGWLPALLRAIAEGNCLAPGGLAVFERRSVRGAASAASGWRTTDVREYGGTTLVFLEQEVRQPC